MRRWQSGRQRAEWESNLDERLHFYDTRGTACTKLLLAGATLAEISIVFGWSKRHASNVIEAYAASDPLISDTILARLAMAASRG